MKIVFYKDALTDLDAIYEFYLSKSPDVAIKIHNKILDEISILENHPLIAAIEPSLVGKDPELDFRSLVIKDGLFKVIYYIEAGEIVIYRVWCCRADPKRL